MQPNIFPYKPQDYVLLDELLSVKSKAEGTHVSSIHPLTKNYKIDELRTPDHLQQTYRNYQREVGDNLKKINESQVKVQMWSFFKDLSKDSVFENQTTKGWQILVSFSLPPSNAMVITDDYLFSNEENGHIVGKSNVIQLVNAFLPANLSIPYHLTILSNDNPEVGKPPKSKKWC